MVERVAEIERNEPALPESELRNVPPRTLVPGTAQFLLQERPGLCNDILIRFLTEDAIATVAPIRRYE